MMKDSGISPVSNNTYSSIVQNADMITEPFPWNFTELATLDDGPICTISLDVNCIICYIFQIIFATASQDKRQSLLIRLNGTPIYQ